LLLRRRLSLPLLLPPVSALAGRSPSDHIIIAITDTITTTDSSLPPPLSPFVIISCHPFD
jgi:hypothetical protein